MDLTVIKELSKAQDGLICLQHTQKLDKDALRHPKWIEVKEFYSKDLDGMQKAVVSIYNALMYHDRQIICMTRDFTMGLVRQDKNHKKNTGLRNDKWGDLLRILFESKIIQKVSSEKGKPWIVEVIDADLLKYIKRQTKDEQLEECINFINRTKSLSGDGLGDEVGDVALSTKDVVTKNLELRTEHVKNKFIVSVTDSPLKENNSPSAIQLMQQLLDEEKNTQRSSTPKSEAPMLPWQKSDNEVAENKQ